ncbi:hypothetical protein TL16_g08180 [Triparma laevis f. inornata]|uniref:CWF21 domain-containing protein n=1 Tax=Triparma laevis f. inornata TaxID=1714386 RepID=A0A9W7AZW1_9STRA|nr:hypothetical protein TL16_g08180 [Triparma laevis f. inornata]
MSYNGIGLSSVRGSATSGHVQGNRSYVRPSNFRRETNKNATGQFDSSSSSTSNQFKKLNNLVSSGTLKSKDDGILRHARLREIESRLVDMRDDLEERRVKDSEIEERIDNERRRLMEQMGLAPKQVVEETQPEPEVEQPQEQKQKQLPIKPQEIIEDEADPPSTQP